MLRQSVNIKAMLHQMIVSPWDCEMRSGRGSVSFASALSSSLIEVIEAKVKTREMHIWKRSEQNLDGH